MRRPAQRRVRGHADFAAKTITTLQLNITSVSATTQNVGLAEIQVYDIGSGGGNQPPVANAGAAQTVAPGRR